MRIPTITLGEACEKVDYGVTASAENSPVGPKFLRITDIQDGDVDWSAVPWCKCDGKAAESSRLERSDIVFARTGATTGKSFLVRDCPENAVFASYLIRVRLKPSFDPVFVAHFFNTVDYWQQITKSSRGVAQPGVNATSLKSLKVPVFPLSEQKRIAEILDRAEALRSQRRAALALLDELTQSIFLDMFGDPVTNPKGLPTGTLGEHIKLKSGDFLPAKKMDSSGCYPVLGGNGINGRHTEYKFEDPQIVIGRVGVHCGCVHVSPPHSWVTDNALYVDERSKDLQFDYLEHALRFANLNQYASKSGQPLISGSRVYSVQVLVPALPLQEEFARRVSAAADLRLQVGRTEPVLASLFASLQHRAFRGEL